MIHREQMNIVIVGHVDHGKSTVVGRLMADTGALPEGKLESVKRFCELNSRPFEYAFLLDALKDEQAQGITIDAARCFFKTASRDYIIIDAPGHIEFLKNMVTGAARAEAALLVIDAHEGIQENSKRHGYLLSMLGITQVVVLVNKMDLINYDQAKYNAVVAEYTEFLSRLGVHPKGFVPIAALHGENIAERAAAMPWFTAGTVLDNVDAFVKAKTNEHASVRFPVQDIYKFTAEGDDRRIIAGTMESGTVSVGDQVLFLPSGQRSQVVGIEGFNTPKRTAIGPQHATGFTLAHELFVQRGELMVKVDEPRQPAVGSRFRASIFWMGRAPMVKGKKYKLKIAASRAFVRLVDIVNHIDATELSSVNGKQQIDRHDVADCWFETTRPIAFDLSSDFAATGRFVIVDNYEIAGGGIITETGLAEGRLLDEHIKSREIRWDRGLVSPDERSGRLGHKPRLILLTGDASCRAQAKQIECSLYSSGFSAYYLGTESLAAGLDADLIDGAEIRDELLRRLGEIARILVDAGQIVIAAVDGLDRFDVARVKKLVEPGTVLTIAPTSSLAANEAIIKVEPAADPDEVARLVAAHLLAENTIPDFSI